MARRRQLPDRPPSRRGKRDYAAEYAYRVRGTKPGQRAEARGHGTGARLFLRRLGEGDLIMLASTIDSIETYVGRDGVERFRPYQKVVVHEPRGRRRASTTAYYWFRRQTREQLKKLIDDELRKGATFSLAPSLDQRRLLRAGEREYEDEV